MLFPTVEFALFFILVFVLSWSFANRALLHKGTLIAASVFFYAWWDWRFVFLLVGSSAFNYLLARLLGAATARGPRGPSLRRALLAFGVATNLGVLVFFKYWNFVAVNADNLARALGLPVSLPVLDIVLPLAVSFFTFHVLSYLIDVYRGTYPPTRSFVDLLLYVLFFPHLVAGPIVRAGYFLPQLASPPDRRAIELGGPLLLIAFGLFKKVVIANHLGSLVVDPVFENPGGYPAPDLLMATYAYAVQIYCDFSAYTDMAIGLARLLGYSFNENFDNPYRSASIQEFWRRWHISLSSWLRDYLYIPLGGSRKGRARTYLNLLVTMFLGGLWHGAAWNFVIWGSLQGLGLAVERLFAGRKGRVGEERRGSPPLRRALAIFLTFQFTCLCWIFFRARSPGLALGFLSGLADWSRPATFLSPLPLVLVTVGLAIHFVPKRLPDALRAAFDRWPLAAKALSFAGFLFAMNVVAPPGAAPFIYFQF